ncbi:DEAD/DEAH box helicase [Candidatus Neomarinimicrobiota bacterium]
MSFTNLGLQAELLRAVTDEGYATPTPIQTEAIPAILAGRDILAGAQTGTGKTAAFVLPMLQMLSQGSGRNHDPRALIVTPTRELAAQVHDMVRTYGKYLNLRTAVVFGGVGIHPQISKLRRGVDILVATPGRLLDHVGQKTVDLSRVEILVLDEADRMLDMGFIPDIRRILKLLRQKRQNLMFSATYATDVQQLARSLLVNPERIQVAPQNVGTDLVTHRAHPVARSRKLSLLFHILKTENLQQALVFTRTRHGADRLAKQLTKRGINATSIHGAKSQSSRTRALADFKQGAVKLLIATDLAARGLDIIKLPYVVNYDIPQVAEDYVHRIGRSGRAGSNGVAITLVCRDEGQLLSDIEEVLRQRIPVEVIPGFNEESKPRPQVNGRPTSPSRMPARPTSRGRAGRRPDRRRQSAAR